MKTMQTIVSTVILAVALLSAAPPAGQAAPRFDDVYELVRKNLGSIGDEELNRLAVEGFIGRLAPRVVLVGSVVEPEIPAAPLSRVEVYDQAFGYFRFAAIERGAAEEFETARQQLSEESGLKGLVLDLRFAVGGDYAEAAAIADLFLTRQMPLLDWETGAARSSPKPSAISLPVAVLTNARTSGAAEALAAVLRETGVAVMVGGATAGEARVYREFPLEGDQRLRVAVGSVRLGSGLFLPDDGLRPDIQVDVHGDDEKAYFEDPYAVIRREGTASAPAARRRTTEAELVRQQRERLNQETGTPQVREQSERPPPITDPTLARALDLLKGISIVHQRRRG